VKKSTIDWLSEDAAARKQAETALRESEEKFRITFDTAQSALIILEITEDGMPGTIVDANETAYARLGYTKEELLKKTFFEIDGYEYRDVITDHMTRLSLQNHGSYESVRTRKDGGRFPVEVNINRVMMNGREVIVTSARDITRRKVIEEALSRANRKLTLLSGITRHDINNQLSLLRGYLALLDIRGPDSTYKKYLSEAETAAERISSMIQFTKEYELIGNNAPVWQDCRILIETAAKQAPLGNMTVINDIPAGTEVLADPMIVRVLYNLMDNAFRYGGEISTMHFSSEQPGHDYLILCEDDGGGIPVEVKETIFERGFGKGTGLGLFLSREILSITGIKITETGEPGKGARFEILVPPGSFRR
jgi:PAS domain S-box-containing protein